VLYGTLKWMRNVIYWLAPYQRLAGIASFV